MYTSVVQAALVIESDQKLASKERSDKKRKFDSGADKADREESSQKFPRKFGRNKNKKFRRKGHYASECNSGNPGVTCFKCGKVGHIARNCKVATQGSVGVDLIPFELGEFDVILGMDWLSPHKANIDYKKKYLLYIEDNVRVTYQGQKQEKKFISIMEARKLLRQGCEAYLAHVVDTEKKAPSLDEIPVVSEFSDVF
ncbi:hypothetical protein AgCh_012737 [Apium graveolens]